MKIYWFYYKSLIILNLSISFFLAFIQFNFNPLEIQLDFGFQTLGRFVFIFMTIGFVLSALVDSMVYKNRKYIYYNLGISRRRLVLVAIIFNLIISGILWIILQLL